MSSPVKSRSANSTKTTSINVSEIIYKITKYDTSSSISLVDRGANRGIAEDDVRIIDKLNRTVDVQGINNHQINDIPIVTAGGVTRTQRGDVILILHQYAYVGKGNSIHSSAQFEHYENKVDDRAIKVGGRQLIKTLDGYVIPLSIKKALSRMKLRPYTNSEWENLPHVIMTSEDTWDPSILDYDNEDDDKWFDSISENTDYASD